MQFKLKIFYRRDAMLTRVLAITLCPCLSVCLSVTSRYSVEMDERVELFLAYRLRMIYPVF